MPKKECSADNPRHKKDALYRCRKCGAEVMKKEKLCKPEKIR